MSLSIGQGELELTPLQIANMACVLANRGYYMTPHIVRPIEGANNQVEKHTVDCDRKYFDIVVEGMAMAASSGTARGASIDSVVICGKTGQLRIRMERITPFSWPSLLKTTLKL